MMCCICVQIKSHISIHVIRSRLCQTLKLFHIVLPKITIIILLFSRGHLVFISAQYTRVIHSFDFYTRTDTKCAATENYVVFQILHKIHCCMKVFQWFFFRIFVNSMYLYYMCHLSVRSKGMVFLIVSNSLWLHVKDERYVCTLYFIMRSVS